MDRCKIVPEPDDSGRENSIKNLNFVVPEISSINVVTLKHVPNKWNQSNPSKPGGNRNKKKSPSKRGGTKPIYNNHKYMNNKNAEFINNLSNFEFTDYSDYELICKRYDHHNSGTHSLLTNKQQMAMNLTADSFDKNNTGDSDGRIDENDEDYDQYIKSSFVNQREYRRDRYQKKLIAKLGTATPEKPILCLKHFMGTCSDRSCKKTHESRSAHKLQLCKLYYGRYGCPNKWKCLYMHENFPCKYYYLGIKQHRIECCKFLHGPPLSDELKTILLDTIENSSEKVFGKTLNIPKERMLEMMQNTHEQLLIEYPLENVIENRITLHTTNENPSLQIPDK